MHNSLNIFPFLSKNYKNILPQSFLSSKQPPSFHYYYICSHDVLIFVLFFKTERNSLAYTHYIE